MLKVEKFIKKENNIPPTELIIALDFSRAERALELVHACSGLPVIFKVGLELFSGTGPDFVRELVHQKNRVFLDLKLHDIPNTVSRVARQAALLHVEMFSLHITGGSAMVKAVVAELNEIPELRPKVLGVSVLTSFDDVRWAEVTKGLTGHAVDVADSVKGLLDLGSGWGLDGVICSAFELELIKKAHPSFYTVVPGIRPEGSPKNDQLRVMTPTSARRAGANAVVVGRPIIEAGNPREVVEKILAELAVSI